MKSMIAFSVALAALMQPLLASDKSTARFRADLAPTVGEFLEQDLSDLLAIYKDLHRNPELSLQEHESARKMAARLQKAGYTVTTNVGGTGVVGMLHNGEGPKVMIRGDMDALPVTEETGLPYTSQATGTADDGRSIGIMHACGHDVHQTVLVGTARILAQTRDRWKGTVMIVAQPAEEIGTGARMMIEDGLFERFVRPDYCLALHVSDNSPAGTIGYTPGWALANVDSVDITIHGQGGHGSKPNETIDPVITAAHVITALQTIVSRRIDPREPGVITVGSVHSGSKHNIIPQTAKLQITVRSYTDETRAVLLDGIREVTVNTCRAMGCTKDPDVIVRDSEYTPATYNDPALAEAAMAVARKALGTDRVMLKKAVMGGEDFGRYPKHLSVPGLMFWLGSINSDVYRASRTLDGDPLPPIHSSKYAPDPEPTIRTGVKTMTSIALSLLETR